VKLTEFHCVLDWRVSGQHANREVLADVLDPIALADRPQAQRDRLIKAFSRLRITGERVAAEV
jgi:hypothetical protein